MIKLIKEFYNLLTKKQRVRLLKLQLLVIITSFGEILGIASVAPFMSLVGDISKLKSDNYISKLFIYLDFNSPYDFVFWVGILVLFFLTISTLLSILSTYKLAMFAADIGTENADRLYKHYLNQNWLFHSEGSSAQLIKQIANESVRVTDLVILPLILMNSKIVLVTFLIIALIFYNPIIAIVGLTIFSILYLIIFQISKRKLSANGKTLSNVATIRFKLMNEAFGGIKDVILLNRREFFINKFEKSGKEFAYSRGNNHVLWQVPRYFMELVAFGAMISIVLFHITTNNNINEILPLLSIYALAAFKLLPAFQQIYASIGQIKGNISAFESIHEDLLNTKNISEETFENENQAADINLKDQIQLDSIYFTYPNKKRAVLNNISLMIPSNSVVGIVGPSGSGKTTLIDVILGLIHPGKGNLEIDKTIINRDNMVSWQKNIGYVPQDIFLSEESIAENIAFGIPEKLIDYDRIQKAIKLAHLDSLINSLEAGLSTKVGERGVQLSGGQRQRIGIARALYHETNVFIFDEATSSLDGITEKSIMNAINDFKGTKTIILVAHRLKTIKNCDIIFFIEDGKLIAQGTYDELLSKNPNFKKMTKYA